MIRSTQKVFTTPIRNGSCSTRGWERHVTWASSSLKPHWNRSSPQGRELARLFAAHERSMPPSLRAGREVITELDDEQLFPADNIYLMTACGSNPSWERPRSGPVRLWTLIGYASSF